MSAIDDMMALRELSGEGVAWSQGHPTWPGVVVATKTSFRVVLEANPNTPDEERRALELYLVELHNRLPEVYAEVLALRKELGR